MLLFVTAIRPTNCDDDNIICATSKYIEKLLNMSEGDSEEAIRWFSIKNMIISGNFQAMVEIEEGEVSKISISKN